MRTTLDNKVKKYSEQLGLFPVDNGVITCAVSGGADSMCMLDIILRLSRIKHFKVKVIHFNHGLRGANSDRDEQFVRDYCHDLELYVGKPKVPLQSSDENLAREARYSFFAQHIDKTALIATAHNADDNAETILMRLARGSGIKGLTGIAPDIKLSINGTELHVIRPLLCATRSEIIEYLNQRNIPHIEDESNADMRYTRNRIRSRIMPELRDINPKFSIHSLAMSESLKSDDDCLEQLAVKFLHSINFSLENPVIPRKMLNLEHNAIASRIIKISAETFGVLLYREHIMETLNLAREDKGGWVLEYPHGLRLKCDQGKLIFFLMSIG